MEKRLDIIDIIVYTVAVYVVTIAIQIYQPATGGYFNLGEAVIYLAALLKGPIVAGIAGGVGASLADLSTGYAIFAPATLVIKFIEGYVAGYLVKRFKTTWKPFISMGVGVLYTALLMVFAYYYWAGRVEVGPGTYLSISFNPLVLDIPLYIWIVIALLIGGASTYVLARKTVKAGEALLLLIAGSLMVLGYFLYEYYISNPLTGKDPVTALAEIPVNIGQAVIGASIAVSLAGWLRRAGYGGETTSS